MLRRKGHGGKSRRAKGGAKMKRYELVSVEGSIDLLEDGDFRPSSVEVEPGHLYFHGEHVPVEGKSYPATLHVILSEDVEGDTAEEILEAATPFWEEWEIIPEPEYQLWVHRPDGELFTVKLVAGRVVSAVGPLYHEEALNTPLDEFEYLDHDAVADGAWVEEHRSEFELAE
jgi:hypothetical protein